MNLDDPLVAATYGLFMATVLLVVATAIPAYQKWRQAVRDRVALGARVIPEMNILKSNLEGGMSKTMADPPLTEPEARDRRARIDSEIEIAAGVIEHSYAVSLRFANEMYIVRHLLTQAKLETGKIIRSTHPNGDGDPRDICRDAAARICRLYGAANASLTAAEAILPTESRTIDGQSFWDRFKTVSEARESEAEKALVDLRRKQCDGSSLRS